MQKLLIYCLAFAVMLGMVPQTARASQKQISENMFQEVKISLAGSAETRADYFEGKAQRGVLFAPGAMFSKESWHFLAGRFQKLGIRSVSLGSGSTADLLNGLAYLKAKGVKKITVIGASAGGAGVLFTLQDNPDPLVDTVVLLAPAGGKPLQHGTMRKLFIVAEDDMISSSAEVYRLYKGSADPKTYREVKGSDHAQRLFEGPRKEEVIQLIIGFITNESGDR